MSIFLVYFFQFTVLCVIYYIFFTVFRQWPHPAAVSHGERAASVPCPLPPGFPWERGCGHVGSILGWRWPYTGRGKAPVSGNHTGRGAVRRQVVWELDESRIESCWVALEQDVLSELIPTSVCESLERALRRFGSREGVFLRNNPIRNTSKKK